MIRTSKALVNDISMRYLEHVFSEKRHQDILHAMITGEAWDVVKEDMVRHVESCKLQTKPDKFIKMYIAERTRLYAESFLDHLHKQVGTQALIDEGLVKEN